MALQSNELSCNSQKVYYDHGKWDAVDDQDGSRRVHKIANEVDWQTDNVSVWAREQ